MKKREPDNYIITELKKGYSPESIKTTLLSVGWTEKQIYEAVNRIQK